MNWHAFEALFFVLTVVVLTGALYCQCENERQSYFKNSKEPLPLKKQLKLAVRFRVKEHRYPSIGKYKLLSGTEAAFMRYYAFSRSSNEKIIGAAIRHPDGMIYVALNPGRHHHVMHLMEYVTCTNIETTRKQGYMTSCGRFVDRKTGLYLAIVSKQIVKKHPAAFELYSEDMW